MLTHLNGRTCGSLADFAPTFAAFNTCTQILMCTAGIPLKFSHQPQNLKKKHFFMNPVQQSTRSNININVNVDVKKKKIQSGQN